MSRFIKAESLTSNLYQKIKTELVIPEKTGAVIELFDKEYERVPLEGDLIHLPFAWAKNNCFDELTHLSNKKDLVNIKSGSFLGTLRTEQKAVRNDACKYLQETGSVIISAQPGFGKTIVSIEIICACNVPTLILIKQTTVINQWIESIEKYAPSKKVVKLCSTKTFDPTADIYIANPVLFKDSNNKFFFHRDRLSVLSQIKLVVVDELHQIVSKKNHKAFFKISPDYFLGLSATPYRPTDDPMVKAVSFFFGENIVKTPFFKKHTVYIVKTRFCPTLKFNVFTKQLDWNHVLTSQATDVDRNNIIVDCLKKFSNRTWLVLVKRVEHAKILNSKLLAVGLESCMLTGSTKEFDKSTKILIGTTCKVGTGFDHSPINSLLIASDCVEYFEQFLGRCMRTPTVEPIVIDFEDPFKPLINHLKIRINKYLACGGEIKKHDNIVNQQSSMRFSPAESCIVLPNRLKTIIQTG